MPLELWMVLVLVNVVVVLANFGMVLVSPAPKVAVFGMVIGGCGVLASLVGLARHLW